MAGQGLHHSRRNKMIEGVCGGIAEWLNWDPTLVRVLYVAVSVFSAAFPGIVVHHPLDPDAEALKRVGLPWTCLARAALVLAWRGGGALRTPTLELHDAAPS